ncbi:MAG: O-antigen ligase family protein, partial [Casimicrobiaceae bacterium]
SFGVAAIAAALRWRTTFTKLRWRFLAPLAALFLLLAFAFADVAQQKAEMYYPANRSISSSLENDPRIALWKVAVEKIGEAPWLGYGFGRGILREVLPAELHDRAMTHPHNTFVGQWLETGIVGLLLFLSMLGALALRYVAMVREREGSLVMTGIVGLSLIAGFVTKNLTDDFFYRSNAKLFWALNAMLLAYAVARRRVAHAAPAELP